MSKLLDRVIYNHDQLDDAVMALRDLGLDKPVRLTVAVLKPGRRAAQNRYWWGVVIEGIRNHVFETTGESYDPEDLHEMLVRKFLPLRLIRIAGTECFVRTRTSQLSMDDFTDLVEKTIAYAVLDLGMESELFDVSRET